MTTRHIPVCIVSTEEAHGRASSYGAFSVVSKPITSRETLERLLEAIRDFIDHPVKELLVVGSDEAGRQRIAECVGRDQLRLSAAETGEAAIEIVGRDRVDCVVLHSGLPDMSTDRFLKDIRRDLA